MMNSQKKYEIALCVLLIILVIIMAVILSGCSTFSPVKENVLSEYPECVVMLNAGEIYKKSDDKSGTVNPLSACISSIKRGRCAREVFNKKVDNIYVVEWDSKEKMALFNECLLK